MKSGGCAGFGCVGLVLAAAVVGLVVVRAELLAPPSVRPSPARPTESRARMPPTTAPTPTPDPDRFLRHPGERRLFRREVDGPRYRLHYGFVDYSGRVQEVSCAIRREAVERANSAFGWDRRETEEELDRELQPIVDREIERRGLTPYVRVTLSGDGVWHWTAQDSTADDPRAGLEMESFLAWLRDDFKEISRRADEQIFHRHGLALHRNVVDLDYRAVVDSSTTDLEPCYDALVLAAGAVASERYFMGLLLAFFQELRYEVPPDVVGTRETFGLWVPQEVMADGKGDCDSKAAAFAALWRHRDARVILILVPQHALVGVEAKPGPGEQFVRVGNRYFVLCEVAGPGKLPPGYEPIQGSFRYVAIDPLPNGGS